MNRPFKRDPSRFTGAAKLGRILLLVFALKRTSEFLAKLWRSQVRQQAFFFDSSRHFFLPNLGSVHSCGETASARPHFRRAPSQSSPPPLATPPRAPVPCCCCCCCCLSTSTAPSTKPENPISPSYSSFGVVVGGFLAVR